eukprot:CAMPEP_0202864378 /NCGR_PEP_ID=MMETSP1391-20130828/4640_1 /ASSEMBLY_ACC=CAM_ASM_000867 /TAXON_ID=1034604 /ORGANISM="Chlamydomonas leiostraca, Strain SAG 11-49" /LENGTH=397 /DNA_ID=CAMNT_0049544111 /DNA_START=57 /DNA_END=1246 /DNA_ORIENTATION=-
MGGPSGHGQRNKAHKSGNKGLSARQKHRLGKEVTGGRQSIKAGSAGGKHERALAAKQHRDAKRQELLEKKRRAGDAPIVVALLPLSKDVDVSGLWADLVAACNAPTLATTSTTPAPTRAHSRRPSHTGAAGDEDAAMMALDDEEDLALAGVSVAAAADRAMAGAGPSSGGAYSGQLPARAATVALASRPKARITLLPPPPDRSDPLSVVDLGKVAEVVLLVVPGGSTAVQGGKGAQAANAAGSDLIDAEGKMALSILRALGLPDVCVAVQCTGAGPSSGKGGAAAVMKDRSAARKRAEAAVVAQLPGLGSGSASGSGRAFHVDTAADCTQLVRHLVDRQAPPPPTWRRHRPALMVESAEVSPDPPTTSGEPNCIKTAAASSSETVTLALTGWVRAAG